MGEGMCRNHPSQPRQGAVAAVSWPSGTRTSLLWRRAGRSPQFPKVYLGSQRPQSKSCVSELTFRMLGDSGWLQSSSLITFQCVACHELSATLIQCGQIVSYFVRKHFSIGPPSCQRLTPGGLQTRRTFSSFQDLQWPHRVFSVQIRSLMAKKKKRSINQKIGFAGNVEKQWSGKTRWKKTWEYQFNSTSIKKKHQKNPKTTENVRNSHCYSHSVCFALLFNLFKTYIWILNPLPWE